MCGLLRSLSPPWLFTYRKPWGLKVGLRGCSCPVVMCLGWRRREVEVNGLDYIVVVQLGLWRWSHTPSRGVGMAHHISDVIQSAIHLEMKPISQNRNGYLPLLTVGMQVSGCLAKKSNRRVCLLESDYRHLQMARWMVHGPGPCICVFHATGWFIFLLSFL